MGVLKSGSSGDVADVNKRKQLETNSETKGHDHVTNEETGKVWIIPFENVDPTGANDNFFYIKNTGVNNLEITDLRISSSVVGQLKVNKVSGVAVGGTAVTPISKNTGKSVTPVAIIETGVDITGLTVDGTWYFPQLDVVNREEHLITTSRIILAPNGAMALQWEPATGILTGTVTVNEDLIPS